MLPAVVCFDRERRNADLNCLVVDTGAAVVAVDTVAAVAVVLAVELAAVALVKQPVGLFRLDSMGFVFRCRTVAAQ